MYKYIYKLNEADYIDFNMYHVKHSQQVRKTLFLHRLLGILLIVVGGYAITRYKGVWSMIVYSIVAILWGVFYSELFFKTIENNVKKMMREGRDTSLCKYREVVIDEDKIIEEILPDETVKKWNKIIKIGESKENIFLYVSDLEAIIIPKQIIQIEVDIPKFIEDIRKYFK